ncbi:regulatory protein RecX [Microbacterium sp. WCS2018Hpa-9]|uniref:regulatory protein RecX n=1 Tax=Microbacterium sp. WCS2018Hpa-9 TaxID=3073635 RepID=UPI00288B0E72|nr:regulatory protein RecX [Microbacterium sp. WCS2018Hpa-9]
MSDGGGGPEQLAPIIPLFGRDDTSAKSVDREAPEADDVTTRSAARTGVWKSTEGDSTRDSKPVVSTDSRGPSERHPARGAAARSVPRLRALQSQDAESADVVGVDPSQLRADAEELLVRKLRTKSLSLSEARMVLRGYEKNAERLDAGSIDDVIDDFCRRGYLDDALLAGQLVMSGIDRKGQGRVALSRALSQRGIPRDVIDAALDDVPDDDAERALEYARSKARAMSRLDGDTALRRLVGQLSRRGYNGSIAMTAAKSALAEASFGSSSSGVRFVDSD